MSKKSSSKRDVTAANAPQPGRRNLAAAIGLVNGAADDFAAAVPVAPPRQRRRAEPPATPQLATLTATPKRQRASTRVGKKGLVLYVAPEVTVALRRLALDQNSDVQQMGLKALQLLFTHYGATLPAASSGH